MLGPDPRGPRHPASSQQPGFAGVGPTVPPSLSSVHTQKLRHGCGCIFGSHWSVTGAGWALGVGMYMPDHPLSLMGSHHRHRRSAHRAPSASSGGRSPGGRGSVRVIPYGSGCSSGNYTPWTLRGGMYMLGHPLGLVEACPRHSWGVRKRRWHYRKRPKRKLEVRPGAPSLAGRREGALPGASFQGCSVGTAWVH